MKRCGSHFVQLFINFFIALVVSYQLSHHRPIGEGEQLSTLTQPDHSKFMLYSGYSEHCNTHHFLLLRSAWVLPRHRL